MSDKTAAELVREWISNHVHPSLEGWVEVYLDDPELDDDMRDIDRWHVDQIEEFIVNTLEPMTDNNGGDGAPLDSCGSLEQALCLNGEDAGWFFSQLLEFFYMEDDEYEEHKRKRHADGGGAAALYNGEL